MPQRKPSTGALQSLRCTTAPEIFRKIYFLYHCWCTQTCLFQAIFGLPTKFDNCCQHYSDLWRKKIYRCTSTFSALNYCSGIFFKLLNRMESGVHKNFPLISGLFTVCDCNLAKIVAPLCDRNGNSLVCLKGQSLLKNGENIV